MKLVSIDEHYLEESDMNFLSRGTTRQQANPVLFLSQSRYFLSHTSSIMSRENILVQMSFLSSTDFYFPVQLVGHIVTRA